VQVDVRARAGSGELLAAEVEVLYNASALEVRFIVCFIALCDMALPDIPGLGR
jgi:hypothetical protein